MIDTLIIDEKIRADEKHGPYHSTYEGWAVIRAAVKELQQAEEDTHDTLYWLDACILNDDEAAQHKRAAGELIDCARKAACEAVHVAATALRYLDLCSQMEKEENDET